MSERLHKQIRLFHYINCEEYEEPMRTFVDEMGSRRTLERYFQDFLEIGIDIRFKFVNDDYGPPSKHFVMGDPKPAKDYDMLPTPKYKRLYRLCTFINECESLSLDTVDMAQYRERYGIGRHTALRDLEALKGIGFDFEYVLEQKIYKITAIPEL